MDHLKKLSALLAYLVLVASVSLGALPMAMNLLADAPVAQYREAIVLLGGIVIAGTLGNVADAKKATTMAVNTAMAVGVVFIIVGALTSALGGVNGLSLPRLGAALTLLTAGAALFAGGFSYE